MIEFERVAKVYEGQRAALSNVNFRLAPGEMAFLTGHSGAGKSTLLRLILGLETASSGVVRVAGTDLATLSGEKLARYRRRVGVVFQDPNLEDDLSVYDNVALPLRISGFSESEIPKRVKAALSRVDLSEQATVSPRVLSGGQQQRVAVARAMASKPDIILADEPTANLDSKTGIALLDVMRQLNQQMDMTFVFSTHDHKIMDRADRLVHLEDGVIHLDESRSV